MLYSFLFYLNGTFGINLFTYTSFRGIIAGLLALCLSIWLGKYFIRWMKQHNISETIREIDKDSRNPNQEKTPTMGGLFVILAMLIPCILLSKLTNIYIILLLVTTILMGILGFTDDYIKTFKKNKNGLNGWWKIAVQVILALFVGLTLRFSPEVKMNEVVTSHIENNVVVFEKTPEIKSTQTTIPFIKNHNYNYADLFSWLGSENKYRAGWIFFVLLTVFIVVAVSNGANLNDGMDGMCAGNSVIIGITLMILAYMSGSVVWAEYFDVMYIPGAEELVIFLSAFVGALVGYLWWNGFPADIYMGDTGSLTIGGIIGVCAMVMHKELMLPILCGVFFMESFSVIIQRGVYKLGKKSGKHIRVWRRTPIHDHFKTSVDDMRKYDPTCSVLFKDDRVLSAPPKITLRFCIITLILAALTILTLKIR